LQLSALIVPLLPCNITHYLLHILCTTSALLLFYASLPCALCFSRYSPPLSFASGRAWNNKVQPKKGKGFFFWLPSFF
jgi:hypothetical protein